MKAGREMDALVAEKVMGWTRKTYREAFGYSKDESPEEEWLDELGNNWWHGSEEMAYVEHKGSCIEDQEDAWSPSINIADAWQVVEEFRRGWQGKKAAAAIDLSISDCCLEEDCFCTITAPDIRGVTATGPTMPLAICLAALKACGVEVDKATKKEGKK